MTVHGSSNGGVTSVLFKNAHTGVNMSCILISSLTVQCPAQSQPLIFRWTAASFDYVTWHRFDATAFELL